MKFLAAIILLATLCQAMRHPSTIPNGWKSTNGPKLSDDHVLSLTVALKQKNLDRLESKFWDVSDPLSKNYRQYMTFEKVKELVAPDQRNVAIVQDYFRSFSVDSELHVSGDFLKVKLTTSQARAMFQTEFDRYIHEATGTKMVKARSPYVIDPVIAEHIDFISGERLPNLKHKFQHAPRIPKHSHQKKQNTFDGPPTIYINPLDEALVLTFVPVCQNGLTTTSANLCSDNPPTISSYNVTIVEGRSYTVGAQAPRKTVTIDVPASQCTSPVNANSVPFAVTSFFNLYNLPNTTYYCTVPIYGISNYKRLSITVSSPYNGQLSSDYDEVQLGDYVTPQVIWELYNVPKGSYGSNGNSSQAVAEFLGQYYNPTDLSTFFQLNGLVDYSSAVVVNGPNDPTNPGGEASLDIQFLMGVAQNITTTFWSLGNLHDGQEPFLDWITNVLATPGAPLVHSISYGDDESSLSVDWMNRVNQEFQKAGVIGISLMFSSGDTGVFGESTTCAFVPSFPASSPYVTAVGATLLSTRITPGCSGLDSTAAPLQIPITQCHKVGEIASSTAYGSRVTSGGGFSNVFPRPSYQGTPQVVNYINSLGNLSRPFNYNGRVYPDVSAVGHNFLVVLGGNIVPIDGTSASAPTFAGIISLVNDYVMNAGDAPLGFLNPLLYAMQASGALYPPFNDITVGDNSCSELAWNCCDAGFPTAVGYDAVTGLGSPNFDSMIQWIGKNLGRAVMKEEEGFLSKLWKFSAVL